MKQHLERLHLAVMADKNIVCTPELIGNHPGNDPKYLEELGLERRHLKKLERIGLAVRGYTKNIWLPGETTPQGKLVEEKETYRGPGHRLKWILIQRAV